MIEPTTDARSGFDMTPSASNHFAWIRTRLALDRTLMAWVRTSTALIGFGFTIVQFFERLRTMSDVEAIRPHAPRYMGLALIASGIFALAISTWQYRQVMHYLKSDDVGALAGMPGRTFMTPLYPIVICLLLIGLFAFGSVLFRIS